MSTTNENSSLLHGSQNTRNNSTGCLGVRHVMSMLGFLGFANVYAMRVNLSVAIVAMVNNSSAPHGNDEEDICPVTDGEVGLRFGDQSLSDGEFNWNEKMQGLILGSFFWGYIITNPIGGRLSEIYGGSRVFGAGVFITSFLTLLTPFAARTSTYLFIALRVTIGLGEGVTFPAMNTMIAQWIPRVEKSRTTSLIYCGASFGTVMSLPICGLLCQSSFLGGWPSVFYVFGSLGILWTFVWTALVYDKPGYHPYISDEEKEFIYAANDDDGKVRKVLRVPYKQIFTSMPFWAILVSHVAQNWGFYCLLTELPTYMNNILHFNIRNNSVLSALPYLVSMIMSLICGRIADWLMIVGYLSVTNARRVFNSIAFFSSMFCMITASYSGCNTAITVTALTLAVGLNGAVFSGYMSSHLDIAPNYAGTLMGFTNCAATVPGFVGPIVVGMLIDGNETLTRWRIVFLIAAGVYFLGNVFYIIFISGEEQPWNKMYEIRDEDESISVGNSDENPSNTSNGFNTLIQDSSDSFAPVLHASGNPYYQEVNQDLFATA